MPHFSWVLLTDSKIKEKIVNFKNISKSCQNNWQRMGLLFFILYLYIHTHINIYIYIYIYIYICMNACIDIYTYYIYIIYIYIYFIFIIYFIYALYIQDYSNFLDIYKLFTVKVPLILLYVVIQFCFLVLQYCNLDLFLNEVSANSFKPLKVSYFEKYCPLNKKQPAEGLSRSIFGELQHTQISFSFQTSCCNLKIVAT